MIGKLDEEGDWLLPSKGDADSGAKSPSWIAARIGRFYTACASRQRLECAGCQGRARIAAETHDIAQRMPYFCSGCPHNTSTVVPEGSRAYAGIGCHYMAQWMDRSTLATITQMGGEGANWIGEAPFTNAQPRLPESRRRHL